MKGRSSSFLSRRRARLALKVDVLDALESRSTVTEPISVAGLGAGMAVGLEFLDPLRAAAAPVARPRADASPSSRPRAAARPQAAASPWIVPSGVDGVKSAPPAGVGARPRAGSADAAPTPWLAELSRRPRPAADASLEGVAPARIRPSTARPGGGAELVTRGGGVAGAIRPLQLARPHAVDDGRSIVAGAGAATGFAAGGPVDASPAAQGGLGGGGGDLGPASMGSDASGGAVLEPIAAGGVDWVGGGAGESLAAFANFPVYVLDYNYGSILFPGFYQFAILGGATEGWVDLRAQVRDAAASTYSWDTTGLTQAVSITGTNTYRLQFKWINPATPRTNSVTLTVTNSTGQQEVQTLTFWVPNGSSIVSGGAPTVTWPGSLAPDAVVPYASAFGSHYIDVEANTGALETAFALPAYSPNVAPLVFRYDSLAADPRPMIVIHHELAPGLTIPTKSSVQLTFNGSTGTAYYYATSAFNPGDYAQFAVQADATSLSTGRYGYSAQVVDYRTTNTTTTYTGTVTVVSPSDAPSGAIGQGWSLRGLNRIVAATGGVILDSGSNDRLWFVTAGSMGGVTSYTSPAGDFSTLVKNASGTYTRTLKDGTKQEFNSSGYETAAVDRNNLRVTYSYDGSNKLTTVADPYGKVVTLGYDASNRLATITDPAGRQTTVAHSGDALTGVRLPDGGVWGYAYAGGRMTKVTDPRSRVVTAVYDAANRVGTIVRPDATTETFKGYQVQGYNTTGTSGSPAPAILLAEAKAVHVDPRGNSTDVRVDWRGMGLAEQTTDPDGYVATWNRGVDGLATTTIDRLNRIDRYSYDSKGNVLTHTFADGNVESSTYNGSSQPLRYTDPRGKTTTFGYDAAGNLTLTWDAANNRTTTTYTASGRVQTVRDARNNVTSYQYDAQDRLTTVTFPGGATNKFAYDARGNVATFTDERNNSTTYAYDAMNRRTGVKDALGNRTTYVYDSGGNLTAVQAPLSRTTTYAYDAMNRVTTTTDPLARNTVSGYDASGNLRTVKDALNRTTTFDYDAQDRLTAVTDARGKIATTVYDAEGQATRTIDRLGRIATTTYNSRGWPATTTDPLGNATTYSYSETGKVVAVSNPASGGTFVGYAYDNLDRVISSTDGLSHATTTAYDAVGNVIAVTDALNHTTSYLHDSRDRLTTITDPLNHSTVFGYDSAGNRRMVKDALGKTTTTLHDALNRATTLVDARGATTTIAYDAAGRRASLIDPVGNRTTWAYDKADRLTTTTDALGTRTYVYDNANQLIDTTDRNLRRVTYSYDAAGRQTGEQWFGTGSRRVTFTYDDGGQLTGVKDPDAALTFTYDSGGNLITAATSGPGTGQPTVTLTYGYNASHERTSVADSLSTVGRITTTYDAAHRAASLQQSFGATAGPYVDFQYDSANRLTTISRTIGGAGTTVRTLRSYDAADRIGTIVHSAATPLATFVYKYDDANRATTQVDAEGTATFAYDAADQLTTVAGSRSEAYGYDANGNRNTAGYTVIAGNRYSAGGGCTFTYDSEGNVTGKTEPSTNRWTYAYDHRNRLTAAFKRNSAGTTVLSAATYAYDALGRRIGTKVDADGAGAGAAVQTWTVYDGAGPDANPYADFTGAGALGTRYLHGPAVDAILARTSSGGTSAWYLPDRLGTIRDVANTSGAVINHVVYDGYGKATSETSPADGDRFKYTGREYDAETGNYYYRARYYDASMGRFLGRDPSGFDAGDANFYRYVGNAPTNRIDPTGLDWLDNIANIGAGWGDSLSFGMTNQLRMLAGINDGIATDSWGYTAGTLVGMAHMTAIAGASARLGTASDVIDATISAAQGDYVGAVAGLVPGSIGDLKKGGRAAEDFSDANKRLGDLLIACFAAGTPLLTPDGDKPIERFVPGDLVLSAPEDDPEAEPCFKRVEEVFSNDKPLIELHVEGRVVKTTSEHPFWVRGRGWTNAGGLRAGDEFRSHAGPWRVLEAVADRGESAAVYNMRVADYHTYFVGGRSWGFSVWAHNSDPCVEAGQRTLRDTLPPHPKKPTQADPHRPDPTATGPHTVIGTRTDPKRSPAPYRQGITYDDAGMPVGRTDVTDHGRGDHDNPHWHPYDPAIHNPFDPEKPGNFGPAQPMPNRNF